MVLTNTLPPPTQITPSSHESRLIETLRKANLRLTPQRLAICRFLANHNTHPTAQDIYQFLKPEYPSLSLATVYNTLEALVSLGAIYVLGDAGDDTIHYDANTSPHINLMCIHCHRFTDLPSATVAKLDQEANTYSGYQILGKRIIYYGICPECQQAERSETVS